ncbi:MAG: polysaccharide deacetylase [Halobacteriales archaeon]|nr:polysaccharide deacetylase [Halobacteriales archaeon]
MDSAIVSLSFDFDGVSPWLHSSGLEATPTNLSRGLFGVDVGAPRILELLDDHGIAATWFTPGHTIDSFPEICEEVYSRGHDIQHHGWSHTRPGDYESFEAERADIERGIESIEELTGKSPTGYRSPSWDFSPHTLDLLQEFGFEWDSSGMAHDFVPYYVRSGTTAPMDGPYQRGEPTGILELPISWQRDDFPPLVFTGTRGFTDEAAVFQKFRDQFEWMYDHVDDGVYILTMHPQVIGRNHRLDKLETLIEHMAAKPGVRFETMDVVAAEYAD